MNILLKIRKVKNNLLLMSLTQTRHADMEPVKPGFIRDILSLLQEVHTIRPQ